MTLVPKLLIMKTMIQILNQNHISDNKLINIFIEFLMVEIFKTNIFTENGTTGLTDHRMVQWKTKYKTPMTVSYTHLDVYKRQMYG